MSHNFKKSLKAGQAGEATFAAAFPHLKKLSGFQSDFVNPRTGATYEVKTDKRSTIQTPNIFIEILSNKAKGTLGGPAQAIFHGTDYWVYMFANKVAFVFNTRRLAAWVESNKYNYTHLNIFNDGYVTTGIIVPRQTLKGLAKQIKIR